MSRYFASMGAAAGSLALAAALGGCADTTPRWDREFGASTRQALAAQVVRPAAVRNTDPVNGMDGASARAVYERYLRESSAPSESAAPLIKSGTTK
jgi:hypothetical protein